MALELTLMMGYFHALLARLAITRTKTHLKVAKNAHRIQLLGGGVPKVFENVNVSMRLDFHSCINKFFSVALW